MGNSRGSIRDRLCANTRCTEKRGGREGLSMDKFRTVECQKTDHGGQEQPLARVWLPPQAAQFQAITPSRSPIRSAHWAVSRRRPVSFAASFVDQLSPGQISRFRSDSAVAFLARAMPGNLTGPFLGKTLRRANMRNNDTTHAFPVRLSDHATSTQKEKERAESHICRQKMPSPPPLQPALHCGTRPDSPGCALFREVPSHPCLSGSAETVVRLSPTVCANVGLSDHPSTPFDPRSCQGTPVA